MTAAELIAKEYMVTAPELCQYAGRYRATVLHPEGPLNELRMVAAGYGDTPDEARHQAESARRTMAGAMLEHRLAMNRGRASELSPGEYRPIPPTMPIRAAADLMVRRGECPNFFRAMAILHKRRSYGKTEITPADKAAFNHIEAAKARLPYKD